VQEPDGVRRDREAVLAGARAHGRRFDGRGPYTTMLTTGCILRPGEGLDAERVRRRVAPVAVVGVHALWESAHGGHGFGFRNDEAAAAFDRYIAAYATERGSPPDRRYLDVHEGHMIYLKRGEEAFVAPETFPAMTMTGSPDEIVDRCRALAAAGVDNLALQAIPGLGRELIEEFGREVIARM
jgi:alkanesulfonate monooxygenase SsuD/methylene tetrahydromethanopterin reductase-like flavin-dependent oxidoreductase (luciferase family)